MRSSRSLPVASMASPPRVALPKGVEFSTINRDHARSCAAPRERGLTLITVSASGPVHEFAPGRLEDLVREVAFADGAGQQQRADQAGHCGYRLARRAAFEAPGADLARSAKIG